MLVLNLDRRISMGENSVQKTGAGHKILRTREDIQALQNIDAKTKNFLNCVFDELDTDGNKADGKLKGKEGEIVMFNDGSVSVLKDGKLYAGINDKGKSFTVKNEQIVYNSEKKAVKDSFDRKTKVLTKEMPNGTKYEYQYNDAGNKLLYSQVTTKDEQKFIYSPENRKIATVNTDGGILANVGNAASLDDVIKALGFDESKKSAFLKQNRMAAENGFGENDTVVIPPDIAKELDINKLVALAKKDETKVAEKPQLQQAEARKIKTEAPKTEQKPEAADGVQKAKTPKEIAAEKKKAELEEKMYNIANDYNTLFHSQSTDPRAWDMMQLLNRNNKNQLVFRGLLGEPPHKYTEKTINVNGMTLLFASTSYITDNSGHQKFIWELIQADPVENK